MVEQAGVDKSSYRECERGVISLLLRMNQLFLS